MPPTIDASNPQFFALSIDTSPSTSPHLLHNPREIRNAASRCFYSKLSRISHQLDASKLVCFPVLTSDEEPAAST